MSAQDDKYTELARLGWNLMPEEIPAPHPQWWSDMQSVRQTEDTLHFFSETEIGQEIIVDVAASDGQVVFNREEVR